MPTERARSHLAIRWLGKTGTVEDYSYSRLNELTNRFANVLQQLGVGRGDRVFVLAGRIPELYIAALGTFKNRSVFCPLFSAFGPEPIRTRLAHRRRPKSSSPPPHFINESGRDSRGVSRPLNRSS